MSITAKPWSARGQVVRSELGNAVDLPEENGGCKGSYSLTEEVSSFKPLNQTKENQIKYFNSNS